MRELWEETGLKDAVLGPCVWRRSMVFSWDGRPIESRERFFVCRLERPFDIGGHVNPDEVERGMVLGHRWWALAEIAASDAVFVPRRLADLLPAVLRGEYVEPPLEVGA